MSTEFARLLNSKAKKQGYASVLSTVTAEVRAEIAELDKRIAEICTHEKTSVFESYSPGSYYDKESWHTWDQCVYCDKKFNHRESIGGYG